MTAQQPAIRAVEQRSRQGHRTDLLCQLAAAVEQHVAQVQPLGFKEGADALHAFALIDEQEGHVLMLMLGVLQHRHFPAAWRAPGGPQVDHQRAALVAAQLHRLAIGIAQHQFWQARAFFVEVA